MAFHVKVKKEAVKNLEKIPKPFRQRILASLVLLEHNPFLGKRLQGQWQFKKGQQKWLEQKLKFFNFGSRGCQKLKNLRWRKSFLLTTTRKGASVGETSRFPHDIFYSLRIWPYRIIYKIYQKELIIFVVMIGHRQGVYQ